MSLTVSEGLPDATGTTVNLPLRRDVGRTSFSGTTAVGHLCPVGSRVLQGVCELLCPMVSGLATSFLKYSRSVGV